MPVKSAGGTPFAHRVQKSLATAWAFGGSWMTIFPSTTMTLVVTIIFCLNLVEPHSTQLRTSAMCLFLRPTSPRLTGALFLSGQMGAWLLRFAAKAMVTAFLTKAWSEGGSDEEVAAAEPMRFEAVFPPNSIPALNILLNKASLGGASLCSANACSMRSHKACPSDGPTLALGGPKLRPRIPAWRSRRFGQTRPS